ncbi:hypothetical protein G7046_g4226 [Stylonectria norvegica]|nr:hypothetical protein G7046_g4226 [Stylonectria norvegica]
MTSICNYSHPELQISEGLVRQKAGTLFPYNPEFYELASGLYGPGSIYCWYLMSFSVIISWTFRQRDKDGYARPGISNDLLAVIAYPAFAATDAIIHAMKMLGMKHRALALFCLRFPGTELTGFAKFNSTQLDLKDIPPDVLKLGQHVVDLTGPISVSYTFAVVCFMMILSVWIDPFGSNPWKPTVWVKRLACGVYAYVFIILTVFNLSFGNLGISYFINFYESALPLEFALVFASSCFLLTLLITGSIMLAGSFVTRDLKESVEALKVIGSGLFIGTLFPGGLIVGMYFNGVRFVPDLAITINERDQLATLIVGIVTLGYTIYEVWRNWSLRTLPTEQEEEEMQTLTTSV